MVYIEYMAGRATNERGTYRTLEGKTLDLEQLTAAEEAFFELCYAAYEREWLGWAQFTNLVWSRVNPVVSEDGMVDAAAASHPLFLAVRDLEDRLGIREGGLAPEAAAEVAPLARRHATRA